MNIIELGAIGGLASGVAVVASLVYVGLQVRQSNRFAQSTALRSRRSALVEMTPTLFSDPTGITVYLQGLSDRRQLRIEERVKFDMITNQLFRSLESLFYEHRDGQLSQELWMSFEREVEPVFEQPGTMNWWFEKQATLTPSFASYVDRRFLRNLTPSEA